MFHRDPFSRHQLFTVADQQNAMPASAHGKHSSMFRSFWTGGYTDAGSSARLDAASTITTTTGQFRRCRDLVLSHTPPTQTQLTLAFMKV